MSESGITSAALQDAVDAGVIDAAAAGRLSDFLASRQARQLGEPDEENLRFITSFNDIFVALGIALFIGPIVYFLWGAGPLVLSLAVALAAWGLAEIFTRRRRMAFPSILLMQIFVLGIAIGCSVFIAAFELTSDMGRNAAIRLAVAGLAAVCAATLHWWRFKVPITIANGVAALCLILVSLLQALYPDILKSAGNFIILACGLAVFALAMRYDMQDRQRVTRDNDIAFWLHLLAAPMIVHPFMAGIVGQNLSLFGRAFGSGTVAPPTEATAIFSLLAFVALALVAIVVDRRALLVSGLVYAGYAFSLLVNKAGVAASSTGALTILALGAMVLLLSAAWRPFRAIVLTPLPGSVKRYVPPATKI